MLWKFHVARNLLVSKNNSTLISIHKMHVTIFVSTEKINFFCDLHNIFFLTNCLCLSKCVFFHVSLPYRCQNYFLLLLISVANSCSILIIYWNCLLYDFLVVSCLVSYPFWLCLLVRCLKMLICGWRVWIINAGDILLDLNCWLYQWQGNIVSSVIH